MTTTIALAGKGGVGKTTTAGMIVKYLAQTQSGATLAIDADLDFWRDRRFCEIERRNTETLTGCRVVKFVVAA